MTPAGIVVIGRAFCGKTTLADALVKLGAADARASFAGELKADLAELGVEKGQPFSREMMIAYGQNRRAMNPDYWIERLNEILRGDWHGLVIDDCRFPNELAFLRGKGYLVVRVDADLDTRMGRGCSRAFALTEDESESALEDSEADVSIHTGVTSVEMSALAVMTRLGALA